MEGDQEEMFGGREGQQHKTVEGPLGEREDVLEFSLDGRREILVVALPYLQNRPRGRRFDDDAAFGEACSERVVTGEDCAE